MPSSSLGVEGLTPSPTLTRASERWEALRARLSARRFFHCEGISATLGMPHVMSGRLLEECRAVVAQFDRFFRGVIADYFATDARHAEFLLNPFLANVLDADRHTRTAIPLARLDCVLDDAGRIRVIEINPNGICTIHMRSGDYLARALRREGFPEDAAQIDTLYDGMVRSFTRFADAEGAARTDGPRVVAVPHLPRLQRCTRATFPRAFSRNGWRYVDGHVEDFVITDDSLRLRGQQVDVVWADWLLYLGYQYQRYQETKWATPLGDDSRAREQSTRFFDDPRMLELFRSRRVLHMSPPKGYLALSKNLLAWIHRDDRTVGDADRAFLQAHVARTWDAELRLGGSITQAAVIAERDGYLMKPCQYGGSHGVTAGRAVDEATWRRVVTEHWADPSWALQAYHEPCRAVDGQWLSFGLYTYAGELGGVTIRTAPSRVISARDSAFIPVSLGA